jgi:cell division protein FtsZ
MSNNLFKNGYSHDLPDDEIPIIKVVGVGGGGGNAVNHMERLGVKGVDFVVCNTDRQALVNSPISLKLQLGAELTKGLGAGTDPEIGKQAAEENVEEIRHLLGEPTQMVFITAGMGGGTGTGAAPVIAKIAREMGLLTIAVVTAPFEFEGTEKLEQAQAGIDELKVHCDTVLVVLNDKLADIYGDLPLRKAFAKADDVLANAVKSIAEMITIRGEINVDFMDVKRVLNRAGQAVMGSADAEGTGRATQAIAESLTSPLLNDRDISGAKRILLTMASSTEYETTMNEQKAITTFIQEKIGKKARLFKHGAIIDESLGTKLRVTVIAAGFDLPPELKDFPGIIISGQDPAEVTTSDFLSAGSIAEEATTTESDSPKEDTSDTKSVEQTTQLVEESMQPTSTVPKDIVGTGTTVSLKPSNLIVTAPINTEPEPAFETRIRRMVDEMLSGRYPVNLETPAYERHQVSLFDIPLFSDQELIRSKLSD